MAMDDEPSMLGSRLVALGLEYKPSHSRTSRRNRANDRREIVDLYGATMNGKRRFVMRPVQSGLITHAGWFSVGLLVLRLKSGDIWCYRGVDAAGWLSLRRAKSKGRWFNRKVRGKLDGVKLEGGVKMTIESYLQGGTETVQ